MQRDEIERAIASDQVTIELAGEQRCAALETLLGTRVFGSNQIAGRIAIRAIAAAELGYRAGWADGREERLPPDRSAELEAAVRAAEHAIAPLAEEARALGERLQDAGRLAAHARAQLAAAQKELAIVRAEKPIVASIVAPVVAPVAIALLRRSIFARLWAFVVRLFVRPKPIAPPAQVLPVIVAPRCRPRPPGRSRPRWAPAQTSRTPNSASPAKRTSSPRSKRICGTWKRRWRRRGRAWPRWAPSASNGGACSSSTAAIRAAE